MIYPGHPEGPVVEGHPKSTEHVLMGRECFPSPTTAAHHTLPNSPDPRLFCCQGRWPSGHTLPAHRQDDTGARSGYPWGLRLHWAESQRPESTGLCGNLVKLSEGWQRELILACAAGQSSRSHYLAFTQKLN